jgi:hypothetical protein
VLESGRHTFFREPTEEKRKALSESDPVECQRYKTALELEARLARAAAKKRRKAVATKLKKRAHFARKT